jgi:hypothetical protein
MYRFAQMVPNTLSSLPYSNFSGRHTGTAALEFLVEATNSAAIRPEENDPTTGKHCYSSGRQPLSG